MGMLAAEAQDARPMNHGANLVLPVRSCLIRLVPIKVASPPPVRHPVETRPRFKRCVRYATRVKNLSWTGRKMIKESRLGSEACGRHLSSGRLCRVGEV